MSKKVRIIIAFVVGIVAVAILGSAIGGQPEVTPTSASSVEACQTAIASKIQSALYDAKNKADYDAKMADMKADDQPSECDGLTDAQKKQAATTAVTDTYPLIQSRALEWGTTPVPTSSTTTTAPAVKKVTSKYSEEQQQAIDKAKDYLGFSAFSQSGLAKQLVYDGFTAKDAAFGAAHSGANWNVQATKKGQSYLDFSHFSKAGLVKQLKYDGFTSKQAALGAEGAFATHD